VPVYNEAANLEVLYASLHAVLEEVARSYEVIFVDDGSSDGTFEVVKQLHERNPAVAQ